MKTALDQPLTAGVCAAALKTCAWLGIVSLALLVSAINGVIFGAAGGLWVASAGAGCVALYFHARLAFDRRLFAELARADKSEEQFDAALAMVLGREAAGTRRTLEDRWQGTRRLVRRFLCSLLVQLALLLGALCLSLLR